MSAMTQFYEELERLPCRLGFPFRQDESPDYRAEILRKQFPVTTLISATDIDA